MCQLSYNLLGEVKRKRCKDDTVKIERIGVSEWKPPFLIQHFCISPTYTVYYQRNVERSTARSLTNVPKLKAHGGTISKKAGRKIRYCFNWLIASSKIKNVYCKATGKTSFFKLNFITLTLAEKQRHSDNYVKDKMLSAFIQWLQRKHGVVSYIWKAESQLNGNIHFHITTNKFVHWQQIRHKWNSIQYQHGYNRGMTQDEFIKDTNGTDVTPVKKESELIGYMVKYFTKSDTELKYVCISCAIPKEEKMMPDYYYKTDDEGLVWMGKRAIEGRLWNHSANLLTTGFSIDETDSAYADWQKVLMYYQTTAPIPTQYATVIPHRRIGIREFPSSVRVLLQNKIELINKNDRHKSLYVVETI
ncbi:MAG: hypothetical protein V4506_15135 [Bacteroidota bacterium]